MSSIQPEMMALLTPLETHSALTGEIALNAIADGLISAGCLILTGALWRLVRTRRMVFPRIFVLLGALLAAVALAHAIAAASPAASVNAFTGSLKLLAGLISITAGIALVRAIPGVVRMPTRAELEARVEARASELSAANEQLRREAAQREQAEAEIRRLNAELETRLAEVQSLFKVLPVGVAIATDASCRKIHSNQAFVDMLGLPLNLVSSLSEAPFDAPENLRVLHDGRELTADELPMQRAIAHNTPVRDFEETIVRDDGQPVDVIANAVPIRDAEGRPRGCVATFQDISARKQAEQRRLDFERKLLQSQKLESIGLLAGGIAHDFNNLLTGMLGHANFARGELARGSTDIDPLLAQVEVSAQRAAELCRQLLAYAGKGRFVVRLIDLNVAVQQAVPLLKLSMSKKISLDLQLGTGLPPFRGDPTQINQVLMNLVANSSEAIGTGTGTVTIRTDRVNLAPMDLLTLNIGEDMEPGPFVALEVRDNGCGIPPEAIAHIFEPFFTTKFVGRGLGLSAVLGIVHGHRGGIRVSSQIGAGTTFELFFPIVTTPSRGTSAGFTTPAPARGTVLVVDDDETVRGFAQTALSSAGFQVATAIDGEDALNKLRRDPLQFDAVLLDLTMPKLDGEDTLMALRMLAPTLPVILTSGHSEQTIAQRFVGRGLADFLPKPFVGETLVSTIASAVTRARGNN